MDEDPFPLGLARQPSSGQMSACVDFSARKECSYQGRQRSGGCKDSAKGIQRDWVEMGDPVVARLQISALLKHIRH